MERQKKKLFICSKLNGQGCRELNEMLYDLSKAEGYDVFSPQRDLPGLDILNLEVLFGNEKAIDNTDVVLVNFLNIDTGGAMELSRARAKDKTIIGFRPVDGQAGPTYLGKMLEGCWEDISESMKANTLEQLRTILSRVSRGHL